jgi:hypothetical protein
MLSPLQFSQTWVLYRSLRGGTSVLTQGFHQLDIFGPSVVTITGDVGVGAIFNFSRSMTESVPDSGAPPTA